MARGFTSRRGWRGLSELGARKRIRTVPYGTLLALALSAFAFLGPFHLSATAAGPDPIPVTPYSGFNPMLGRAPYLSDLTQNSVEVNWAETTDEGPQGPYTPAPSLAGYLTWGPAGSACNSFSATVPSDLPSTVGGIQPTPPSITGREYSVDTEQTSGPASYREYQSAVELTGLAPSTAYCYRVYGWQHYGTTKEAVDLLGSNPSPTFTTLDRVSNTSTAQLSFDVLGDTGEACTVPQAVQPPECTAAGPGLINPDQAAIDSLVGQSGARFVVMAGDVGYPSGLETRYGDLQNVGTAADPDISNIFGPSYWPLTGGIPAFYADGNHGLDVTSLRIWPEEQSASNSGGVYGDVSYAANVNGDGALAAQYPANWYAFSTGNVRIYVLTAAWADGNGGTAANPYQVDADQHWQVSSAEYQWLASDLAAHPGGIKFVVWHYPLRSYSPTETSDTYLQNSSLNPNATTSVESLLAQNGVYIVFDAHAHTYQRLQPSGPGQVLSYVTGGGGGVLGSVSCSGVTGLTSAYALGWDPTGQVGSSCGVSNGVATSPAAPSSAAQVYNFLEVAVQGPNVTVTPVNAAGQTFDEQTYQFDDAVPDAPGTPTAVGEPSAAALSWIAPANESTSAASAYQITPYQNGTAQAPIDTYSSKTSYVVTGLTQGDSYTFTVAGIDDIGTGPPSAMSNAVVPTAVTPAYYTPVTPYRVCDTRPNNPSILAGENAQCNSKTLTAQGVLTVQIGGTNPSGTSSGGVPSTATAVVLNVTATDTTAASYLTVWPAAEAMPLASSLNWSAGQTQPNLITVALSSQGTIQLFNANGDADVVVDVEGWLGTSPPGGGYYNPIASPYRVCDTRPGNPSGLSGEDDQCNGQTLSAGSTLTATVAGTNPSGSSSGGVPSSGATAVDLTVTVTDPSSPSYLTVWPAGSAQPTASNLNFAAGETVANNVMVLLPQSGANAGQIEIYNANGNADVVVDVEGYYSTTRGSSSSLFTPMVPSRICDTRPSSISRLNDACTGNGGLRGGQVFGLQVAGVDGIPAGVTAVVLNVTVTDTSSADYLTVFPYGSSLPLVSSLNWSAGETVATGTVVSVGSNGYIAFYIPQGQADLVVDVVGWEQ